MTGEKEERELRVEIVFERLHMILFHWPGFYNDCGTINNMPIDLKSKPNAKRRWMREEIERMRMKIKKLQ